MTRPGRPFEPVGGCRIVAGLGLVLVLLAAPLLADAQPTAGKVYRIGWLASAPYDDPLWAAFVEGLRERGWLEGRNFTVERRHSDGRNERFAGLVAQLIQGKPDLLVTGGTPATAAAQQATRAIPIVFFNVGDPVESGFVASLARPGGNLTGLASTSPGLNSKMIQLLKEAVPGLSRVAVFVNSTFPLHVTVYQPEVVAAARSLNLTVRSLEVRAPDDLDAAFATIAREKLSALVVLGQPPMFVARARLAKLALDHRVAAVNDRRETVEAGVLMSYGDRVSDSLRRLPYYIDRIFRGAKPADLPVEQPTKFYLAINLKTARALGLTISPSLLLQADQLIE
jgi:putative ABC transport system substrate-binding protein